MSSVILAEVSNLDEPGFNSEAYASTEPETFLTEADRGLLESFGSDTAVWLDEPHHRALFEQLIASGSRHIDYHLTEANADTRESILVARRFVLHEIFKLQEDILDRHKKSFLLSPLDQVFESMRAMYRNNLDVPAIVRTHPSVIGFGSQSIQQKVDIVQSFKDKNGRHPDIPKLFNRSSVVTHAPETIQKRYELVNQFLDTLKWQGSNVELLEHYPQILSFSSSRLTVLIQLANHNQNSALQGAKISRIGNALIAPLELHIIALAQQPHRDDVFEAAIRMKKDPKYHKKPEERLDAATEAVALLAKFVKNGQQIQKLTTLNPGESIDLRNQFNSLNTIISAYITYKGIEIPQNLLDKKLKKDDETLNLEATTRLSEIWGSDFARAWISGTIVAEWYSRKVQSGEIDEDNAERNLAVFTPSVLRKIAKQNAVTPLDRVAIIQNNLEALASEALAKELDWSVERVNYLFPIYARREIAITSRDGIGTLKAAITRAEYDLTADKIATFLGKSEEEVNKIVYESVRYYFALHHRKRPLQAIQGWLEGEIATPFPANARPRADREKRGARKAGLAA